MQIEYYKRDGISPQQQNAKGLRVAVPGYVSTNSWTPHAGLPESAGPVQKGRVTTPPPAAAMGLHQLTLEAFWHD